MHHHLLLAAYKRYGTFTEEEMRALRNKAFRRSIDNAIYTYKSWGTGASTDAPSTVMLFDVYDIKQLGFLKRTLHYLRVFLTTVSSYVGYSPTVIVVVGY